MKVYLLCFVGVILVVLVLTGQAPVEASAATRFRAVAASAKPDRFTPKPQELLTGEAVTGGVAMTAARIHTGRWEKDPMALLTIDNGDSGRSVKRMEFSAIIYDRAKRTRGEPRSLFKDVDIKPGKSANLDISMITPLPAENLLLLQITKVIFTDGSSWTSDVDYALSDDLAKIISKPK